MTLGSIKLTPAAAQPGATLALGEQSVGYTLWAEQQPANSLPRYGENATVVVSTQEPLGEDVI